MLDFQENDIAAEFRRQLFQETGARRGLQPIIVEKDFWVCWTLRQLFCISDLQSNLVFKGGTTLSKIHSIIRRFSEDIDVTVDRGILGFSGERDPELALSKKKRRQLTEEMIQACREFVQGLLLDAIRRQCSYLFESSQEVEAWSVDPDPNAEDGQTILFRYPLAVSNELEYLKTVVRLELGSRADAWPTGAAQYSRTPRRSSPIFSLNQFARLSLSTSNARFGRRQRSFTRRHIDHQTTYFLPATLGITTTWPSSPLRRSRNERSGNLIFCHA